MIADPRFLAGITPSIVQEIAAFLVYSIDTDFIGILCKTEPGAVFHHVSSDRNAALRNVVCCQPCRTRIGVAVGRKVHKTTMAEQLRITHVRATPVPGPLATAEWQSQALQTARRLRRRL